MLLGSSGSYDAWLASARPRCLARGGGGTVAEFAGVEPQRALQGLRSVLGNPGRWSEGSLLPHLSLEKKNKSGLVPLLQCGGKTLLALMTL